jgi:hypothetical protein
MSDRRYGRDDLGKPAPADREISLTELVDGVVRRVVTAVVIAGGLVAIGAYAGGGGDVEAPRYQIAAADGRVYRVNTENGTIVGCVGNNCAVIQRGNNDLEDGPLPSVQIQIGPDTRQPALPAPPAQNGAAPAQPPAAAPAPAPAPAPATR